ncbi:MAG TPA: hypothetical protein VG894_00135 [Bauldia sp.]|nr:hypothetical protein [Bauldia sp.]
MTTITLQQNAYGARRRFADWILAVAAILGFVEAVLNYFFDMGIAYSGGALLVVISTFLILAVLVLVRWWTSMPRWLGVVLAVLTFLDFIGTGIAGYFLEAYLLVLLMVVALIAWLFAVFMRPRSLEGAQ